LVLWDFLVILTSIPGCKLVDAVAVFAVMRRFLHQSRIPGYGHNEWCDSATYLSPLCHCVLWSASAVCLSKALNILYGTQMWKRTT